MEHFKYNGAGNDFFAIDARGGKSLPAGKEWVVGLCDRNSQSGGSDGIIVLSDPETPGAQFSMGFFNPDGSSGMMCGNGGRCIVAFAADLGIKPSPEGTYLFDAPDGCVHVGRVVSDKGDDKTISITMRDIEVSSVVRDENGVFADTGTRHLVVFVEDTESVDVMSEGGRLRNLPQYGPIGVNVNFVQPVPGGELRIRTFEKGVEGETLACGTGNVAAALAAKLFLRDSDTFLLHARGGDLIVDFSKRADGVLSVTLTGPTRKE